MSNCFNYITNLFKPNYPKDIRNLLNIQYKKIHNHEKKIKNIQKNCHYYKFLWFERGFIDPINLHRIKRNKYLINKANKEILGIKKYYNDYLK